MNSVAETREPAIPEDIAAQIHNLMVTALKGKAGCEFMLLDDAVKEADVDMLMFAAMDLRDKFGMIAEELEQIWSK